MKIFGVLLLIISTLFNGERPCAHALGIQVTDSGCHEGADGGEDRATHAGMDHGAHSDPHPATDKPSHHCADECAGGDDCNGCSAISATLSTKTAVFESQSYVEIFSRVVADMTATPSPLEPPPPKTASLI